MQYDWSSLNQTIVDYLNTQLKQYDWSYLSQQLTPQLKLLKDTAQSVYINFDKDSLEAVEQLNIPIEEYSSNSNIENKTKIFTIPNLIAFISLLMSMLMLIQSQYQFNESVDTSEKVSQQLEEIIQTEEHIEILIETIIEQTNNQ